MRSVLFVTFGFFLALLSSVRAEDAAVVGVTCSTLGATTMSSDQKSLVACLKSDTGDLIWKSMTEAGTPVGTIAFFALAGCPDGWSMANGSNNTLDVRGEFLRVWDGGRGVDTGRKMGSAQGDAIRNIAGVFSGGSATSNGAYNAVTPTGPFRQDTTWCCWQGGSYYGGSLSFDASRSVPTANENRPRNIALLACQKN